eukprot:5030486-Heterocapsa_arctica.AAC.1
MRNKEAESDITHSERGCGERQLQGLIGDRMKGTVKETEHALSETLTRDSFHKTNEEQMVDGKQMNMKLGDGWFRVDGNRRRAHRLHDDIFNTSMKTRSLAQKGTGAKGATH